MKPIRYILLFPLAFASCIADRDGHTETIPPPESRTIVFSLSNSSPTRAIDDIVAHEGDVNRVDVFFYDAAGTCLFYPEISQQTHDAATQRVTITIPAETYESDLLGTTCTVFLVVNGNLQRSQMAGLSLDALKNTVMDNGADTAFNTATAPAEFLMTGETTATITSAGQNLGTITLRRAAAKIVVDISSASVEGYTPGTVRVRLSGYLNKTRLGAESEVAALDDYATSGWKHLTPGDGTNNTYSMDVTNAFYSYYNDWSTEADRETYITIGIEWSPEGSYSPKEYFYRIPFSYINTGESAELHRDKLRRNYVYQFMVNVSELGGIDPEDALDLMANFDVIEWTDRDVEVSILSYHYLFVYNSSMQVHETPSYEWEYRSSLPVAIEVRSVTCTEYYSNGSSLPISYVPGDPQYPVITQRQQNGKTYFSASSIIPVNYVPLVITLKVSNVAQLFSNVKLTIYPKKYVTSSFSDNQPYPAGAYTTPTGNATSSNWGSNNPSGDGPGDNFNFYRITTTSLDAADEARGIMIGDPTQLVTHPGGPDYGDVPYYQTMTDDGHNNIISPDFIVGSRRGITLALTWDNARERCARYRESQYPAGTWRVPTFAELAMLGNMQNDPNSAIKNLFVSTSTTGSGWWSARQRYWIRVDQYTYATGNGVQSNNATATAFVRCVHDIWRD